MSWGGELRTAAREKAVANREGSDKSGDADVDGVLDEGVGESPRLAAHVRARLCG